MVAVLQCGSYINSTCGIADTFEVKSAATRIPGYNSIEWAPVALNGHTLCLANSLGCLSPLPCCHTRTSHRPICEMTISTLLYIRNIPMSAPLPPDDVTGVKRLKKHNNVVYNLVYYCCTLLSAAVRSISNQSKSWYSI